LKNAVKSLEGPQGPQKEKKRRRKEE